MEKINELLYAISELETNDLNVLVELGYFDELPTEKEADSLVDDLQKEVDELIDDAKHEQEENWIYKNHYSGM